jgi:hypothetical protein
MAADSDVGIPSIADSIVGGTLDQLRWDAAESTWVGSHHDDTTTPT